MPTVLLLRQLDAPFATVLVGFVFPRGNDPLLKAKVQIEIGWNKTVDLYLEKIVVRLLWQG